VGADRQQTNYRFQGSSGPFSPIFSSPPERCKALIISKFFPHFEPLLPSELTTFNQPMNTAVVVAILVTRFKESVKSRIVSNELPPTSEWSTNVCSRLANSPRSYGSCIHGGLKASIAYITSDYHFETDEGPPIRFLPSARKITRMWTWVSPDDARLFHSLMGPISTTSSLI
jgi:hypothetical protein